MGERRMRRLCIIVDQLTAPSTPAPGTGAGMAWTLARGFAEHGDAVTILHSGSAAFANVHELAAAANNAGARYLPLREIAAPFDVPLFPTGEIHAAAHKIAAGLRTIDAEWCIVLDRPAALAIALLSRCTGLAFERTKFVIVASELPRETARLLQHELPAGGREEIIHDYLERRAYSAADTVIALAPNLAEALRETKLVSPDRLRLLPGAQSGSDHSFEIDLWLPLLEASSAAPQEPSALPAVTVCMPYYEQPAFLDQALASLATQTFAPLEVLVMDDGSKTASAMAAFSAAEKRYADRGWRFLHQANAGPAAARNRMVELARGEVVVFCDADNRFRPTMLEAMARAYVRTGADCVTCAFQTFSEPASPDSRDRGYVFSPLGDCLELGLVENVLGDTNFLVRRSTFLQHGGFAAERLADEDWQFLLQLLRRGGRVASVPAILFDYRRMATSRARRQGEFASAAITLAPVLAELDPAWKRLWPQIVAAIRNPRIPQLEHELQEERLLREADVIRLQNAIEATRLEEQARRNKLETELHAALRRGHRLEWEIALQKEGLNGARQRAAELDAARQREAERAASLEQELATTRRERDEAVARRDDKIRRMQESWSWQVTAPGRAIRRAFVDPSRKKPAANLESQSSEAAAGPQLRFSIDRPVFWEAAPAAGTIAGWCLFHDQPARAFRVRVGDVELSGQTDLSRKDVAQAHGFGAAAARCGFEFRYRLPVDHDQQAKIEAQGPDGSWHLLKEGLLHTSSHPRETGDYASWIDSFDTITPEKRTELRQRIDALKPASRPLVSVLMPVHNTPERWLVRAIESVREQIYEDWELCVADDASTALHVRPLLEKYQAADPRIRVTFRQANGHISAASNSALDLVRGEFVALLDHDDELSPDALAQVILMLAENPETDLVFSDEDKIDEDGRRSMPYFKPDYLPDLLLGQNCISHLSVFRTSLVRAVGGFRVGYEGSQDWDLALRVIDQSSPQRIRHLPKVLYHWRAISGSTAVAVSAKNYSVEAARRALLDHFRRRNVAAEVRPVTGDHWQVIYPLPEKPPLVTIIIPTKNAAALLRTCVGSIIARTEYPNYEILVVNNRSDDAETLALFELLKKEDNVRVVSYDAPFNFSAINNFAIEQAQGEILCFLNNDMEVITGRWLDEMVSHAVRPEIGAVGAMLYYPDNTIQHAGVVLGLGGIANHAFLHHRHGTDGYMNRARLAQNYSAVTGACLLVRRSVFSQVGGFNEQDLAVAFNDIDLCLKIRSAGYRNLWTPFAELYHHESASRGSDNTPEKQARFSREIDYMRRTWGDLLDRDPAYNPNLALNLLGWALAWSPRRANSGGTG